MAVIADDLIAPAMHSIGHLCESGALDVSEEHRATQLCAGALHELRAVMLERATTKGALTAVGGAPEGDYYVLASLLAEMVLLESGWNVINLGAHTPMSALTTALRRWRPALVWLSISHLPAGSRFVHEFADFCHIVRRQNTATIVGGRALTGELQMSLPCAAFGAKMAHLGQLARSLAQRKHSQG